MRRDYTAKITRDRYYTRYIVSGYESFFEGQGTLVFRDTYKTEKEARKAANNFMKRHFKHYNKQEAETV